ncbi:MAG: isocitrate/isopropylmalate family dehydrogenase [candidate division WOR-3 bacterium]
MENEIKKAQEKFEEILRKQIERVQRIKTGEDWIDYSKLKPIIIGIAGGDGIGPFITDEAFRVLKFLLSEEEKEGKIEFKKIEGLTIEERAKVNKAVPPYVLDEIKKCHVLLKGPTTTPKAGDPWPNIESANVALRKELDLFANIRPVRVPSEGIDWIFFRENTEDLYAVGSEGIDVTEDLSVDFKVITTPGSERIIKLAFEYAKKNGKKRVTAVTKANVIKKTDGRFLKVFYEIAKEYPEIEADDWFIDIMTAKLIDKKRRTEFQVLVMPNLYGDILTDEAAEFQGGVGTAGSANVGKRYAMFEAIHGSAPRMVEEGRARYADPSSIMRASAMLLRHIGYKEKGDLLDMALDICGQYEKKLLITGRSTGATGSEFTDYVIDTLKRRDLKEYWLSFQSHI